MKNRKKGASREKESLEIIFNHLYKQYFPLIYRYSYRLVGNLEEARQFTQQTFTKLYDYLTSKQIIKKPKAFIYRIATNICYDYLRKKRKINEVIKNSALMDSPQSNPDEELAKRERIELIRSALLKLPSKDQKCLILYQEGFSYAEIAQVIRLKKTSVGKILSRATEKLALILKKEKSNEMFKKRKNKSIH